MTKITKRIFSSCSPTGHPGFPRGNWFSDVSNIKFEMLFNTKNIKELTNLAKFVKIVMTIFA